MSALLFPKLVIASHNEGKVREIAALLSPYAREVISAASIGLPEPEETGDTFAANAALKAEAALAASGLPCLADDSGLVVPALHDAPGIYSARWAGPSRDFKLAMQRVQAMLGDNTDLDARRASFVCTLALARPGQEMIIVEGTVQGHLVWPPRGDHGFGYDPMFVPAGYQTTFGEMPPDAKQAISHRTDAFYKLGLVLKKLQNGGAGPAPLAQKKEDHA